MREDLAARLDRMTRTFEESRERILAANDAIAALRVTRRSDDRLIEVTVGADRGLADLRIADEALECGSGRVLARAILSLATEAKAELVRVRHEEYQRLTGLTIEPGAFEPGGSGSGGGSGPAGAGAAGAGGGSGAATAGRDDPAELLGRLSRELFGA